jgi:hypothetical protein
MNDLGALLQDIRPSVNVANARTSSPIEVLAAMWEIGEHLRRRGVRGPYRAGTELQSATGGIVKGPLIARSMKVRKIWPSEKALRTECSSMQSLWNVIGMLPFLYPDRREHYGLTEADLTQIRSAMVQLRYREFLPLLKSFKQEHSSERLGKPLDRERHLPEMAQFADRLINARDQLMSALEAAPLHEDRGTMSALAATVRQAAGASGAVRLNLTRLPAAPFLRDIVGALHDSGVLTRVTRRRRLWRLFPRERLMELAEAALACSGPDVRREFFENRQLARTLSPFAPQGKGSRDSP